MTGTQIRCVVEPPRLALRPIADLPIGTCRNARWPRIEAAIDALHRQGRRSIRIVDADCGSGALLLGAVRHARSIGFVAIEGRGIDGAPALIGRARHAAEQLRDPAIGLTFEVADQTVALAEEAECPADILLAGSACLDAPTRAAASTVIAPRTNQ